MKIATGLFHSRLDRRRRVRQIDEVPPRTERVTPKVVALSFCLLTKETLSVMKGPTLGRTAMYDTEPRPAKEDPRRLFQASMVARDITAAAYQGSSLDEITNRIRNANTQASIVLERLSHLGDQAFGVLPEPVSTSEKVDMISCGGAVDRIFNALGELDHLLSQLETAENRVHGLA